MLTWGDVYRAMTPDARAAVNAAAGIRGMAGLGSWLSRAIHAVEPVLQSVPGLPSFGPRPAAPAPQPVQQAPAGNSNLVMYGGLAVLAFLILSKRR